MSRKKTPAIQVIPIPLGITKAFLIKDDTSILVDTGCPHEEQRIVAALGKHGVSPRELRLILHTHAHYDHCGSTSKLKELTGAPTALHRLDLPLARKGKAESLKPIAFGARLVRLISYRSFEPFEPDVVIDGELDLKSYGISGRVISTPGHTLGSVSILLENGQAIAGDLMVGGYLGGRLWPRHPGYHYFADDATALPNSMRKLMDAGASTVYVAHGGPLCRADIIRRFRL